jgi:hypothetical protein
MTQKFRFPKSKRSPKAHLTPNQQMGSTGRHAIASKKVRAKRSPKSWKRFLPLFWLLFGIGGLAFVLGLGLNFLTTPGSKSSASSCQSKLAGKWQTNWGELVFEEKNNSEIVGRYEFYNLKRGKVKGQISGTVDQGVFSFDWQEKSEKGVTKMQGTGIFNLSPNCQEFTGSYGTGSITNASNWQGKIIPSAVPPKPVSVP